MLTKRALLVLASLVTLAWAGGGLSLPKEADALPQPVASFEPLATYAVSGSNAEIVAATVDGKTLIYTDAGGEQVGFVDISNPAAPVESRILATDGEPTSVDVTPNGKWALVSVHGDPDHLLVVDLKDFSTTKKNLGGQPDAVAVSPNGRYAAIAIENERDEDVNDGEMPQDPPGFLTIVDIVGKPEDWKLRKVDLTGIANRFPEDPETEFVTINHLNQVAVTLQENNHIVIVNLVNGKVIRDWSAGTSTHKADLNNEDDEVHFDDLLKNARREPDGIAWTPLGMLVTANEGDYDLDLGDGEFTGGRDFTIFGPFGHLIYQSFSSLERAVADAGFYNDGRSDNSGIEPEGVEIGVYGLQTFLFVGGERCDCVVVYRLEWGVWPKLVQVLPTGVRPEGLLSIPKRNLFVTANEDDGSISIFQGVVKERKVKSFSED